MTKEPYVKPEVKSEILEAEALSSMGSPTGNRRWLQCAPRPSCGFCCDD
jgi:hypothetical protein